MNINYHKEMEKIINGINNTPSLLLHACCGPCSSYVIEYLSNYFNITILFYNPNIFPSEEYSLRVKEIENLLEKMPVKNKVNLVYFDYDSSEFYNNVKNRKHMKEGGEACIECYRFRLKKTVEYAKEHNYDYFTTTLSISPYKDSQILNDIGRKLEEEYNIKYLYSDFKKNNGYKRSSELTKLYGMYRQDYCGCVYSKEERDRRLKNE